MERNFTARCPRARQSFLPSITRYAFDRKRERERESTMPIGIQVSVIRVP